jgi:hypothetical protein
LHLDELETILSAWLKQAHTANISIDEPDLKKKALHVAASQGMDGFQALNGWINRFKKIRNLVYKTTSGKSAIVNPKRVMDWKSEELPKIIDGYQPKDIFNVDETGFFYNLRPSKTMTYRGDFCHGGTKLKQRVTVLLGCKADGQRNYLHSQLASTTNTTASEIQKNSPPNTQQFQFMDDLSHF